MRMIHSIRFSWLLAGLVPLLACSHDSKRDNPLDPGLTPAVSLREIAVDDSAGTSVLSWTPYEGNQPFAEYWVLTKIRGLDGIDTTRISDVSVVTFVDSNLVPDTVYEYRVSVVNAAGYEAESNVQSRQAYSIAAVGLLSASPDPEAGTVSLRWSRYRDPGFDAYRILRHVGGSVADTLDLHVDVLDTLFVDDGVQAFVAYTYSIEVLAAGRVMVSNNIASRLELPAVQLAAPEVDSQTASATLGWTPYTGPRFSSYRVLRRTSILAPAERVVIEDRNRVTYVDSGLAGNSEYLYTVEVNTERGEVVASEEQSSIIHPLVTSWSLDLEPDDAVRLYGTEDGVRALVAGPWNVTLRMYSGAGEIEEELDLLTAIRPPSGLGFNPIKPRSASIARSDDDHFLPSFSDAKGHSIYELDNEGMAVLQRQVLFADSFSGLSGAEAVVSGDIVVLVTQDRARFALDNLSATTDDRVLFQEDFENGDTDGSIETGGILNGWLVVGDGVLATRFTPVFKHDDSYVGDLSLEIDAAYTTNSNRPNSDILIIQLGRTVVDEVSQFTLTLDWTGQMARLVYAFQVSPQSENSARNESFVQPVVLELDDIHHIRLAMVEGNLSASIGTSRLLGGGTVDLTSITFADGLIGLTSDGATVVLDGDGQPGEGTSPGYDTAVSETRSWESGTGARWYGVSLPSEHQVLVRPSQTESQIEWPAEVRLGSSSSQNVGEFVGQAAGELLFPISFDAAADDRIYILDAGNSRVQSFDEDGTYITQWGGHGSGDGNFDFGRGSDPTDFAGSIAVDGEGFIYVADVANKRIQKFAP